MKKLIFGIIAVIIVGIVIVANLYYIQKKTRQRVTR